MDSRDMTDEETNIHVHVLAPQRLEVSDDLESSASLMTPLGLVSGEALTYIERHPKTTLRQLIRSLPWPTPIVIMSVGALIREGLIRGVQRELEIVLEPCEQGCSA